MQQGRTVHFVMGIKWLQKGDWVADAAFPNASFPAALKAGNYKGFCTYLSSPTNNAKNWTPTKVAWFGDMGCGMFCEQFETIVLQGYSAANLALGRQCEQMANDLGVPLEAPMWYAVDISPFGHFNEIAASFQAYNDTNRRPIYAYCGSQCGEFLLDEGLVQGFHVPSAVSWSATSGPANGSTVFTYNNGKNFWYLSPLANMRQYNSVDFSGSRIDPNEVLRPTPFWVPTAVDPPPPPPTDGGSRMANFVGCVNLTPSGGAGAVVWGSDGQWYKTDNHPGGVFYAFPRGTMGDAEYAQLPLFNPAQDAYWVADRFKERGVGGGGGAAPRGVRIQTVPGDAVVLY